MKQVVRAIGLFLALQLNAPLVMADGIVSNEIASPPILDGVIDEGFWKNAKQITSLSQVWPQVQINKDRNSLISIAHDASNLYVAAQLSIEHEVVANTLQYGKSFTGDDEFIILLDTFASKQNAYWFSVNPNGVKGDGLIVNNNKEIPEWDGVWYAASKVKGGVWTIEMALPFQILSFDPDAPHWGVNIVRKVASTQQEYHWLNVSQDLSYSDPRKFGRLQNLSKLDQGIGLGVRASASLKRSSTGFGTEFDAEPSVDLYYKFTPSLTSAFTFNTDFAGTEADERQLNFGRFNLFLPEKRQFFLQDAGIFEFGNLTKNGRPFFSRKIGLNSDGSPIAVNHGARFSGYGNDWGLGMLSMNTESPNDSSESKQLTVLRGTYHPHQRLRTGFIFTQGDPYSNKSNSTFGFDMDYQDASLPNDQAIQLGAWLQQNDTEGVTGDDAAWGLYAKYPNDLVNLNFEFSELQKNFDPALGFVNRNNIRKYVSENRFRRHFERYGIQLIDTSLNTYIQTNLSNDIETANTYWNYLMFTFDSGDFLQFALEHSEENLREGFNLLSELPIGMGRHRYTRNWVIFNSSKARRWQVNVRWNEGGFYTGSRSSQSIDMNFQPTVNFNLGLKVQSDDISIGGKSLSLNQYALKLDVIPHKNLSWQNFIQYDDLNNRIGLDSRIRWVYKPGFETNLSLSSNFLEPELGVWQKQSEEIALIFSSMWLF